METVIIQNKYYDYHWCIIDMRKTVCRLVNHVLIFLIANFFVILSVPITTDVVSSNLDQGARCTTSCDTVCQWLATGRWFSPCPTVSSTNKTDRHDITEILLKVALNTTKQNIQTNKQIVILSEYSINALSKYIISDSSTPFEIHNA